MVWIFALGVLVLAVLHPGFRKVVLWLIGITTALVGGIWLYTVAPAALAVIVVPAIYLLIAKGITSRGASPSNTRQPDNSVSQPSAQLREYQPPPLLTGPAQPPPS